MIRKYDVEVDCANCAAKMEAAARKIEGVKSLTISFMTQKMTVELEQGWEETAVMQAVEKVCKKVDRDFRLKK